MAVAASAGAGSGSATHRTSGLVEVDLDVFITILMKLNKPLVLERRAKVPKGFVYVVGYGDYFFILKEKAQQDFTRWAEVIPVKRFYQGWAMSTL